MSKSRKSRKIRTRNRYIRRRFSELQSRGMKVSEIARILAQRYYISERTVLNIVYRN